VEEAAVDVSSAADSEAALGIRQGTSAQPFDEMVTGGGSVRPHWQSLFAVVSELGRSGIAARAERARRQLEDDGITFNLYEPSELRDARGGGHPVSRPWQLDPLPLLISAAEWSVIERGVAQRALLLDRVLADLYGPQELLSSSRYPPTLVFGNPDFLRPCRGTAAAAPTAWLQHYAVDLARGPDGIWRVVADRAQNPSGAAFALHHRRVMTRVMGEAFRAHAVRPLAGFFDAWSGDLQARAPRGDANPRLVLLTPGPFNEAYVEHVSLARELGATLVEGADLTAREGRIYLKTLGGLLLVDTILRRIDGAWCDPLELRPESRLGVVGLVDAVRAGGVTVANAIGTGLVDAPALAAFLPRLAQHLLGEELLLPSVATWWCGQPYALAEVLDRLEGLAIRPAMTPGVDTINVDALDPAARDELVATLRARPAAFAAQERSLASLAPGNGPAGLEPQPVVLRVFATATNDGYTVMPGGLARVPADNDPLRTTLQRGAINKDVWVLADDPTTSTAPPRVGVAPVVIRRTVGELPSRAADDLFWLGRYMERIDDCGRLLRAGLQRLVGDLASPRDYVEMATIVRVLAHCGVVEGSIAAAAPESLAVRGALLDAFADGTLLDEALQAIERLAAAARDRFSIDMRRTLHHLIGGVRSQLARVDGDPDRLLDLLDELVRLSAALSGLASENMTRGSGWRFLDLGRRIERGIYVARVVLGVSAIQGANWDAALRLALELCDSVMTYRTRYLAAVQDAAVLDLVILDATNPQSLGFQAAQIAAHLQALPVMPGAPDGVALGEMLAQLERIIAGGDAQRTLSSGLLTVLRAELRRAETGLMVLSDDLGRAYFSHVQPAQVLGALV
jgi:uncharacterized circularly permuted ATP-grasp superfamily protein/uncharacterized alpha-E superfamily protein